MPSCIPCIVIITLANICFQYVWSIKNYMAFPFLQETGGGGAGIFIDVGIFINAGFKARAF